VRGKGTEWLSECEPGELLDVSGPIGSGFSILPATKNLLLVAGGIGIAPFVYVADKYGWGRKKVTLLAGAATKKQLFPNILPPQVEYIVATEDGSAGHRGMVTDLLPEYAPAAEQILACGPLPMYRHMAENPGRCGITGKSVQVSMEMRMACAMGVCYGCTIRTTKGVKQACKDGPVFRLDEIIWDDLARV
jgi:dihydroorotate dehydrogenase electron transfer subunit